MNLVGDIAMKDLHMKPTRTFTLTARTCLLPLLCSVCWLATTQAEPINDPTRPYTGRIASTGTQRKAPQLQGIYRFGDTRVAIVDGALVREGDQLQQMVIVSIGDDYVRYARKGTGNTLSILRMTNPVASTTHANAPTEEQP